MKRKRSKPRRGRVINKPYLAWIHTLPCAAHRGKCGIWGGAVTAHHVRRYGEPKNDLRTIPLCACAHLYEMGSHSIERIGKEAFQKFFAVDIEALIVELNNRYLQEQAA